LTAAEEETRRRAERARKEALFRYELIQDVIEAGRKTYLFAVIDDHGRR
jgi:hypothetical protein